MEGIDRMTKIDEVKEHYVNEFEEHGLIHIKIDYTDQVKN